MPRDDYKSLSICAVSQELEKIAPKEKGIITQSVKDVVKSLVDDSLVDTDKIGTSVYFWAFPSKARHAKRQKLCDLKTRLDDLNKKLKVSREKVLSAKVGREDTEKRAKLLQTLQDMKRDEQSVLQEIQKYKDSDPEALEKMKQEIKVAKDAANRWTDNIYSVKSWCKNKFFIEGEVLDKQFGIPADFDYFD